MFNSKDRPVDPKVDPYLRSKIWPDLNTKLLDLKYELAGYGIVPSSWYLIGSFATDKARGRSDIDIAVVILDREQRDRFYGLPFWGESTSFGNVGPHRVELTLFDDEKTIRCTEVTKPLSWDSEQNSFELGTQQEVLSPKDFEREISLPPEARG